LLNIHSIDQRIMFSASRVTTKLRTNYAEIVRSVVTVAGICNSVGCGIFLKCHRGAGGEYQSVSKLGLLIDIRIATGRCYCALILDM